MTYDIALENIQRALTRTYMPTLCGRSAKLCCRVILLVVVFNPLLALSFQSCHHHVVSGQEYHEKKHRKKNDCFKDVEHYDLLFVLLCIQYNHGGSIAMYCIVQTLAQLLSFHQ
jgi:hypothetical protein